MVASPARKRTSAKSRYLLAALLLSATVLLLGWVLSYWITEPTAVQLSPGNIEMNNDTRLPQLFGAAVGQMQQGRYREALDLWHKALLLEPGIPEIKVNMGFSLYELGEYTTARDAFINAIEQNAYQANAYYGLAIASEKMGDLEGALGAMRSYIHLASAGDDDRFIRRARSALWEWETRLAEPATTPVPGKVGSQPVDH